MRVVILRHGTTELNKQGMIQGSSVRIMIKRIISGLFTGSLIAVVTMGLRP